MKHTITVNTLALVQALKDAGNYVKKDALADDPLGYVLLRLAPKTGKLTVIACDGLGYYERRLDMEKSKTRPSLPRQGIRIASPDVATLARTIPARTQGELVLEIDDARMNGTSLIVTVSLSNGLTTTFLSRTDLTSPDFATIKSRAEKGKKENLSLTNVQVPVNELLRAGKVFPGKKSFAHLVTARGINRGIMALLECKDEFADISVIFMLNQHEAAA